MFSYLCTRKSVKQMKTLELNQQELNCILFIARMRLNSIRGFHTFEEDHLESVINKLLKIQKEF